MKRVKVHIDRLVLRGFRHEDRHGIATGLQQELGRLFADPQATQQVLDKGDASRLRAGSIKIDHTSTPLAVGVETARGIGREMTS